MKRTNILVTVVAILIILVIIPPPEAHAAAGIIIDTKSSTAGACASPCNTVITTSNANDVLVIFIASNVSFTISVFSGSMSVPVRRGSGDLTQTGTTATRGTAPLLSEWYSTTTTAGTYAWTITASSGDFNQVQSWIALSNADTNTPFDQISGLPVRSTGTSGIPNNALVQTGNANDFVIAAAVTNSTVGVADTSILPLPLTFTWCSNICASSGIANIRPGLWVNYETATVTHNTIKTTWGVKSGFSTDLTTNSWAMQTDAVQGAPHIILVTPPFGSQGTSVTLTGAAFNGATAVTVCGINALSFNVLTDTSMSLLIPAGSSATPCDILVTNTGGGQSPIVQTDKFSYGLGGQSPGGPTITGVQIGPLVVNVAEFFDPFTIITFSTVAMIVLLSSYPTTMTRKRRKNRKNERLLKWE